MTHSATNALRHYGLTALAGTPDRPARTMVQSRAAAQAGPWDARGWKAEDAGGCRHARRGLMNTRTNEQWLAALAGGPDQAEALADLRAILVRGLRYTLAGRVQQDLDALVEDFAQDALLKILDKLDTFRGESRFTTWANKVAVRVAFTELRRLRWRDRSLEAMTTGADGSTFTPDFLADPSPTPELTTNQQLALGTVLRLIDEALTDRQREAMTRVVLEGTPMDIVADELATNRNALYKLLHDARMRLKKALIEEGLAAEEVLALFA